MTTSVTLLRELRDVPPGTHFPRSPQGTVPHFSKGRGRGARDSSDLESASLAVGQEPNALKLLPGFKLLRRQDVCGTLRARFPLMKSISN